jgi:hypothetical protein
MYKTQDLFRETKCTIPIHCTHLMTISINLLSANMVATTMAVPKVVTTHASENLLYAKETACTVALPKLTHNIQTYVELWNKIWISKKQNQQIYESIAQFDPASMTENPYKKVTTMLLNPCNFPEPFLNLCVYSSSDLCHRNRL